LDFRGELENGLDQVETLIASGEQNEHSWPSESYKAITDVKRHTLMKTKLNQMIKLKWKMQKSGATLVAELQIELSALLGGAELGVVAEDAIPHLDNVIHDMQYIQATQFNPSLAKMRIGK